MQSEVSLRIDGITKRYGPVTVVDDVSFEVRPREFFTLLGPSGCGKTTLLRMIAGFATPDNGKIVLDGKDITNTEPHKRGVGLVFQNYALFPHMTVAQNLAFGLKVHGIKDKNLINDKVRRYLDIVQLLGFEDKYPRQLSGGQQQRVALARSLVLEPKVVLLDEPLSNLDLKLRMLMQTEMKKILEIAKASAIYVTHDQGEALSMSDRVAIMNKGKIVQVGSPMDIYNAPTSEFSATFVGEPNLLHGVAEKTEKATFINLGRSTKLQVTANSFQPHSQVSVLIKPERIKLSKTPPAIERASYNVLKGKISLAIFRGMYIKYQIEVDDTQLSAMKTFESPSDIFPNGSEIYLVIDPKDIVIVKS